MTRVLFVGDVFGKAGRKAVSHFVPVFLRQNKADLVVVNAENAAGGKGITKEICQSFFNIGVDVITTGNHIGDKQEVYPYLQEKRQVLCPINHEPALPGAGSIVVEARNGERVGVVNAIGTVHIGPHRSPFDIVRAEVLRLKEQCSCVVLDFHAEATSEKRAMGWFLDGQLSAMLGTHTHVQTADEEILPQGTAYLTDVGMTGPYESVIGLRIELAMERFLSGERRRFEAAKRDIRFCAVLVTLTPDGKAVSIVRINEPLPMALQVEQDK